MASHQQEDAQSPNGLQLATQLKEVTAMFTAKSDELAEARREHAQALETARQEAAANLAALEAQIAQGGGTEAGTIAVLKAKDAEIAALNQRASDMISRIERLEGERTYLEKKGEQTAAKVASDKDDEITQLKIMFTEVSEKRKESFLQLKERLRTASDMLQKNAEQHAADAALIADLQAQLDASQRAVRDKQAEVSDYAARVHSLEHEKGDLFQSTSAQLQSSKNENRDLQGKIELLGAEYNKLVKKAKKQDLQDSLQERIEMSIESLEGGGTENGKALRLKHTYPQATPVQWYRSFRGTAFTAIPGVSLARGTVYVPTIDDIGAVLKGELTVPAAGGILHLPIYREIGPVGSKRNMVIAIQETIKKQEHIFNVDSAYDSGLSEKEKSASRPQILLNKDKIKLRAGGKTVAKAEWSNQLRVVLDTESSTRFTLRVDAASNPVSYAVAAGERDLVVQTIRSFNAAMIVLANTKAQRGPAQPADAVLALAYLIRSSNEQRSATARASAPSVSSADGPPLHVRQQSLSVQSGAGDGDASEPSTPHRQTSGGATASASLAPTPLPKPADAAAAVAVAKIKGSNGEDLEIDADGFVIRKDSGWGPAGGPAASSAATPKKPKADGDDSDFSADEDEVDAKPAFQVKINEESRPRASGADLRKSISEFGLGPVGGKKPKKDKSEKKEKKDKKKRLAGEPEGVEPEDDAAPPLSTRATSEPSESPSSKMYTPRPPPSPPRTPAATPSSSAPPVLDTSATAVYAATAATPAAAVDPNDLFALLDSESAAKAPPSLGAPSPSPAKPPAPLLSPPVPRPSPPTPASPPALSRTTSMIEEGVDVLVMETIHARILDGEVLEYAVFGEILLNVTTVPTTARSFDFTIFNTESMTKLAPNAAVLAGGQQGAWTATIPAGTDQPLCVLKYKVGGDPAAKHLVPLQLNVAWACTPTNTTIDVDYALKPILSNNHTKLIDVKFLIAVGPDQAVKQCLAAVPKCMWSPQSQKMMWQLANLPAQDTQATSGHLHAELLNADLACQPSPLSVSFMSDDLDSVLSGILVVEGDKKPGNTTALPLGRLIYRLKSGTFSVSSS